MRILRAALRNVLLGDCQIVILVQDRGSLIGIDNTNFGNFLCHPLQIGFIQILEDEAGDFLTQQHEENRSFANAGTRCRKRGAHLCSPSFIQLWTSREAEMGSCFTRVAISSFSRTACGRSPAPGSWPANSVSSPSAAEEPGFESNVRSFICPAPRERITC